MTKKELGQHWLRDREILRTIVEAGEVHASDHILEIGPGEGTLTEVLIETNAEITAVEFDKDLAAILEKKFAYCKKLAIKQSDIRQFDYLSLPKNYKVIANIPYYLTSNLVRALSETTNPPQLAVLLVQKEVAERLCALPGDMSILAVTAQFYFTCELDIVVPAEYFTPPPKVDSQVVKLTRQNSIPNVNPRKFFELVKAGFSERRKTLRNSLSGGLQMAKDEVESLLASVNISPSDRAQNLSMEQWIDLYHAWRS